MCSQIVSFVGLAIIRGWLFLERFFFAVFPDFAARVVQDTLLIDSINSSFIKVRDSRFYITVANKGPAGLAEARGKGWVEIRDVEQFMKNLMLENKHKDIGFRYKLFLEYLQSCVFFHPENLSKSRQQLYEIEYDLLETMLGENLICSTGTFNNNGDSLESAQRNKMDEIAEALQLGAGKRVMDIGCGWGGTAKYLAKKYGASVIATTISRKGFKAVRESCADLDVTPILEDCNVQVSPRGLDAAYALMLIMYLKRDRRRAFFERVAEALNPNGLFFLQFVGCMDRKQCGLENGLTNRVFEGISPVYLFDLLKDIEDLFTLKSVKDVGRDDMLTKREWLRGFRQNRTEWEDRVGKEYACLVEMGLTAGIVTVKMDEIQVWNIVLCKKS